MNEEEKKDVGQPLKFATNEELQSKIDDYFKHCDDTIVKRTYDKKGTLIDWVTKPYTITGLASYLDTNRQTLLNYTNKEGYFDTIKKAKVKIEASYEERGLTGTNNSTMSIFTLKNNFAWKDNQGITDAEGKSLPTPILMNLGLKHYEDERANSEIQ